jgi:hypothetical protein
MEDIDAKRLETTNPETVLYVWAGDQARVAPDFLAVVDFDEHSANYGRVIRTVPVPPPGTEAMRHTIAI